MDSNTEYRIFVDRMIYEISELAEDTFNKIDDPEAAWKFFRDQLKHYKREQIILYLETDDETE